MFHVRMYMIYVLCFQFRVYGERCAIVVYITRFQWLLIWNRWRCDIVDGLWMGKVLSVLFKLSLTRELVTLIVGQSQRVTQRNIRQIISSPERNKPQLTLPLFNIPLWPSSAYPSHPCLRVLSRLFCYLKHYCAN
jgi:hypothetical protein